MFKNIAFYIKKKWIGNGDNFDGSDREEEDSADIPSGLQAPDDEIDILLV